MAGRPPKNITGKRSCGGTGKLTAITPTNEKRNKEVVWICRCDCGKDHRVRVGLFSTTDSCGCAQYDHLNGNNYGHKHGHTTINSKSPTYISWSKMKDRCLNPDERIKKYYNKEMLCERWYEFENFFVDMGERTDGCEIHRIDNNKGYSPDNCKWKEKIKHITEHNKPWKLQEGDKEKIIELCKKNVKRKEIAEKFGISLNYVHELYYRWNKNNVGE